MELGAEVGQFLIPIAAGSYALYRGDYAEAGFLILSALAQKVEIVFLKSVFPRERPNGLDSKSFPSGHTAGAFLGAGFLAARGGLVPSTGVAFFTATLIGLSRCLSQNHFPSDVLAGASLGVIHGFFAGSSRL